MDSALKWAEEVCPLKDLVHGGRPVLLVEPWDLAGVINTIDGPLVQNQDIGKLSAKEKLVRESMVANIACGLIPNRGLEPYKIVSCMLRAWAGCLGCAKTIAFETRSGPNTPEHRKNVFDKKISVLAKKDPYYLQGVMAGPDLRILRGQGYSLDGVPEEYIEELKLRRVYERQTGMLRSASVESTS